MRAATAVIDLAALSATIWPRRAAELAGCKVVAVVKANGYGHGAARVLPALAAADMLGVACIEEALALREAGATQPILLLEGVFEADELPLCARLGFEVVGTRAGPSADAGAGAGSSGRSSSGSRSTAEWAGWASAPEAARTAGSGSPVCAAAAPSMRLMSHFAERR